MTKFVHINILVFVLILAGMGQAQEQKESIESALARAGENRGALREALANVPKNQKSALQFLLIHMPRRDLLSLSSADLLENVDLAYQAWMKAPWKDAVPEEIFLNEILPFANVNERRDQWRRDFNSRFFKLVANAKSPQEAAAILNQNIFKELKVRYSTKRPKPDQSPYESMKAGMASCTGLSILLVDACRSVGVPARFVGTPMWSDGSGNHSWVEVWDNGWHFTGAAEPTGNKLNQGWFTNRAAKAVRDDPKHAIFAVSYKKTPLVFPLSWDESAQYVSAVNVTDRYTNRAIKIPDGKGRIRFRVINAQGQRVSKSLTITEDKAVPFRQMNDAEVVTIETNDERFDSNDHGSAILPLNRSYCVSANDPKCEDFTFVAHHDEQLITLHTGLNPVDHIALLKAYLAKDVKSRGPLGKQSFAQEGISKTEAEEARTLLWQNHVAVIKAARAKEMKDKVIHLGNKQMKFTTKIFGKKPKSGRSLYISLHGGGGAPAKVNDQQWRNQQLLYAPKEGVYVAPRAPTNSWNLWHQGHIDKFFDRLIENMIVFHDVNPNRVYVMGYSAGGDGVYQLAPRMADRWAATAMMAGHPNDASPLGLRNIGFILQMGGQDKAYKRNLVAAEWKQKLKKLKDGDPEGYHHLVKIYPEFGHWMNREDAIALPWMAKFERRPNPTKVVWLQDDVLHSRFYWLAVAQADRLKGAHVVAARKGPTIAISPQANCPSSFIVRLNDEMTNLDRAIKILVRDEVVYHDVPKRTIAVIAKTLAERGDPASIYDAEIKIQIAEK